MYNLNDYLENELLFIAKEIENIHENTNKKYNSEEIIKLLEEYNYNKLNISFIKEEKNYFFVSGIAQKHGKSLMNLTFYISEENYFHINGVTQKIGIPGMNYDSRNKMVDRDNAKEFYVFIHIKHNGT